MAKRKITKSRKGHKTSSVRSHNHAAKKQIWGMDQDFIIIVGGGFLVVVFLMMFLF